MWGRKRPNGWQPLGSRYSRQLSSRCSWQLSSLGVSAGVQREEGGRRGWQVRVRGVVSSLLFEAVFRATDDLSSCSFEGQYAPRGPDTRTNDENTDSSGQPPGVGPTKMATTYVTQSGDLWVPVPLSKPATAVNRRGTRAEATRRALTFKTRRGGKDCVVLEAPDSHRMATTHPSSQVGARALYCCESTQWP